MQTNQQDTYEKCKNIESDDLLQCWVQPTASSHVNKYNPLGNELGNVSIVIKVYTFNSVITHLRT